MAGRCRPSTTAFFLAKLLSRVGIRWVARWCMRLAYLPLCAAAALAGCSSGSGGQRVAQAPAPPDWRSIATDSDRHRSEEHTSELQSLMRISYAVFCLKKKTKPTHHAPSHTT